MIIDDDTDGDVLLDSYEDSVGLDKFTSTDVLDDNDGNGNQVLLDAFAYAKASVATLPEPDLPPVQSDANKMQDGADDSADSGMTEEVVQRKSSGGSVSAIFVLMVIMQGCLRIRKKLITSAARKR